MTDVLRWATGTPEHQHHPWWAVLVVALIVAVWVGRQVRLFRSRDGGR